jgi:hypothetical protein
MLRENGFSFITEEGIGEKLDGTRDFAQKDRKSRRVDTFSTYPNELQRAVWKLNLLK